MFNFLKEKLNKAIESISKKVSGEEIIRKAKKEEEPKIEKIKPKEKKRKKKLEEKREERAIEEKTKEKREEKKKSIFSFKGIAETIKRTITETTLEEGFLDEVLWELDIALLENNVASEVAEKICSDIKNNLKGKVVKRKEAKEIIEKTLKETVEDILNKPRLNIFEIIDRNKKRGKPTLILFFGFNGSGKTTSIAKLAYLLQKKKYSCVLAAGDTFRAAAIQQLEEHANNLKAKIIMHKYGADPAAVIFDAYKHAEAKKVDVVLADTAGRTHTNINLFEELRKIVRVNKPDIKLLVMEAIAGNDIIEQAKKFDELNVDGIIMAKWDVDEKGGSALSVVNTLNKPIVYFGVGQQYADLKEFDVKEIIKNII